MFKVIKRFGEATIANASVNDVVGLWYYTRLVARNRWVGVETPVEPVLALGSGYGTLLGTPDPFEAAAKAAHGG